VIEIIKRFIRYIAVSTGRGRSIYKRLCHPNTSEWASYMARWGGLYCVGSNVEINLGCNITDPALVRIGSNVTLSDCALLGHDGVIRMLNTRFNKKLDSVGAIDIRDNFFIGYGAIVMPRVTVGPDSIVAAGAIQRESFVPRKS
jgi:acetyltransferase-like isoleucine patch superfamily enzyme